MTVPSNAWHRSGTQLSLIRYSFSSPSYSYMGMTFPWVNDKGQLECTQREQDSLGTVFPVLNLRSPQSPFLYLLRD